MAKISIIIPTYNEEENVIPLHDAICSQMTATLPGYDYEILYIDNKSKDSTRERLTALCRNDIKTKAIFNARNFGQNNSPFYGLLQTSGDCSILMCADFQDPVDMIPKFVHEWENGFKIVVGIKTASKENSIMYGIRTCYYKLVKKFSDIEQIEHFTGFGLYDKSFLDELRGLDEPTPFLRGLVAELGYKRKDIEYEQQLRKAGHSHNNFFSLYDVAMLSITSYTKIGLRLAVFAGSAIGMLSVIIALVYLVMKLLYWNDFPAGMAPVLIGMMFLGAVQLFFIGFIGEYILAINTRTMKRPLVIEERRINFK